MKTSYSNIRSSFAQTTSKSYNKSKDFVVNNGDSILGAGAVGVGTGYVTAGVALATGSVTAMKVACVLYYGGLGACVIGATGMIAKAVKDSK